MPSPRLSVLALALLLARSTSGDPPVPAPPGDLAAGAARLLASNLKRATVAGRTLRFTCPDAKRYPFQWLWDSAFHVIGLRWIDPALAREETESLLSGQWDNGMVPNMVHIDGGAFSERFARWLHHTGRNTSGITQPPILAEAVLRLHAVSPDRAFLDRVLPRLDRYHDWIARERDPEGEGLPIIYHPWESGADDSPRWDPVLGIRDFSRWRFGLTKLRILRALAGVGFDGRRLGDRAPFVVRGIDMACYYLVNLEAMAQLSSIVGQEARAAEYRRRASVTRRAILGRMWSGEAGMFVDLIGHRATQSTVRTPFGLLPLYAGIVDDVTARRLAATLDDPGLFASRHPVPSVAVGDPRFDPRAYWRGTVWINVNWFLVQGLRRYGMEDRARRLTEQTLGLLARSGFREYFDPVKGDGLGAERFSWTAALAIDLLH